VVAKVQSQRHAHLLQNVRNAPTHTYYKYPPIPTEIINSTSNTYDTEYRTLVYSTVNFYSITNNYTVSSTYNFLHQESLENLTTTSLSLYAAVSDNTPVSHLQAAVVYSQLYRYTGGFAYCSTIPSASRPFSRGYLPLMIRSDRGSESPLIRHFLWQSIFPE